jgi:hypothetical protein
MLLHVVHHVLWVAADPSPLPETPKGANAGLSLDLSQIFTFAQFGLLGIFFVMLISKKFVVPKWTLDATEANHTRELADKDAAHLRELAIRDQQLAASEAREKDLKKNLDDLQDLTRQQMLPAMIEANRLTALYVDTLARRSGSGSSDGR